MQFLKLFPGRSASRAALAALMAVTCSFTAGCSAVLDELDRQQASNTSSSSGSSVVPAPDDLDASPEASPLPAETAPLDTPDVPPAAPPEVPPAEGERTGGMRELLASIDIKGRAPKTGYARDQFGQKWRDIDRNGCDQRNDVLHRDLHNVDAPAGCKVLSGVLEDPYTATTINFVRGQDTSSMVQIDHVVAMADAWQKGAQQLTPERREQFANDPMNLLAVDGPANQQKSAGDAATWLPANKAFRCQYVSIQIRVKAEYQLWVTPAEREAMDRELNRC